MIKETLKEMNKLESIIKKLPSFCRDFFIGIETTSTVKTQIRYAYDLDLFFNYIRTELGVKDITLEYMDALTPKDIEEYLHYSSAYVDRQGFERTNGSASKSNKLSALRSFYKYFYSHGLLHSNPALLVNTPKVRDKAIVKLEPDEVSKIIDKIQTGEGLSKRQLEFADKTRYRDIAIFTLLLATGMRVSECVGINLSDISFEASEIKILRKGLKEQIIYFSDEVETALKNYIEFERDSLLGSNKEEDALFISMKHKRIAVRTVEDIVKKYVSSDITVKNISPHKLRSTFGTQLYNATGDIYLVAAALGHENVNTTKKHYAKMDTERIRNARNIVRVRKD